MEALKTHTPSYNPNENFGFSEAELTALIAESDGDYEAGRFTPAEEVFSRLEKKYAEMARKAA